ncbi:hypothetical protein TraAM80_02369 [Trypanosoma rangeli]|uniref:Leucine-rich repeat protein (LRRP) n=1 Tax=Trypanosoma rangeli TaxID=5698 RepID=A0A3R7MW53_TRYRA|nr:uncharacterized protein TraAM80_02369 [Trypanosoma rangeli]RNF08961.1 hypothetical protein TraAM80_02369 [Trypanosoma rangeli]|eukprot:RNF08961.1 hypothetical protein TraAM80_02369 [Trypanosoma rangeli]
MKDCLRSLFCFRFVASCADCGSNAKDDDIVLKNRLFEAKYLASLLKCCTPYEPVIPPPKWRRSYGKWVSLGPKGAEALSELLMNQLNCKVADDGTRRMLTLDLHSLRIGDDGVRAFAPFIAREHRLVSLVLSGNDITDKGVKVLLEALQVSSPSMQRLSLIGNPLTAEGVRSVCELCANSSFPLTELAIGRGVDGKEARQSLVHAKSAQSMSAGSIELLLSNCGNTLVSFTYGGFKGRDFAVKDFLFVLQMALYQTKLRHLALHDCYTTIPCSSTNGESSNSLSAPFRLVSEALCSPTAQLQSLNLQISLSEEAVTALAVGISGATVLARLSLRGCNMSAESLRIIGKALDNNRTLLFLDLSHQSKEVEHPLCDSYRMSQIHSGEVNFNTFHSRRPLLPIFEALHRNRTLQELILLGIDVVNNDVEELCACVERSGNCVIRRVQYTGVNSKTLAIKLEGLLRRNRSHNDVRAGTNIIKNSDPTKLQFTLEENVAQCKLEAQMEQNTTPCTRITSICEKPTPLCVPSSSQMHNKLDNKNNSNDTNSSGDVGPMETTTVAAVSSSLSDSGFSLASSSFAIYSPRGGSCQLNCVGTL